MLYIVRSFKIFISYQLFTFSKEEYKNHQRSGQTFKYHSDFHSIMEIFCEQL